MAKLILCDVCGMPTKIVSKKDKNDIFSFSSMFKENREGDEWKNIGSKEDLRDDLDLFEDFIGNNFSFKGYLCNECKVAYFNACANWVLARQKKATKILSNELFGRSTSNEE